MDDQSRNFERGITVAGTALFLALIGSVLLLMTAPYDTGQRGLGHGAVAATEWLIITWMMIAFIFAVLRWRKASAQFHIVFVVNAIVFVLLGMEFLKAIL